MSNEEKPSRIRILDTEIAVGKLQRFQMDPDAGITRVDPLPDRTFVVPNGTRGTIPLKRVVVYPALEALLNGTEESSD